MAKLKGELGPLERSVMEAFWLNPDPSVELSVRDVLEKGVGGAPAYTTIMTVLDRLWRKSLVRRRRAGRAFLYRAAIGREEYLGRLVGEVLDGADDRQGVLLGFVRSAPDEELADLRAAIRQVEAERRRQRHSR